MKNTVFEIKKISSVFPFLWHLSIKIRFYYFESQSICIKGIVLHNFLSHDFR
jgi:hypothetical protein